MGIESKFIWFDGEMVPFADAKVHVLSHTLHYGLGVFEGIRAYRQTGGGGGVFSLNEHIRRLEDSARMCRMDMSWTRDQLVKACLDTLRANEMEEAYIRPIVFFGAGEMGLGARNNKVHVAVAVWNWGRYLGEEGIRNGIRVQCSTFTRHHVNSNLQRAKVIGHYVNSILARYEATENGYDEAIMLDGHGYVAEGTGENLFVARDGVVKTPPVVNILGGITRRTAIDILRHENIPLQEMNFGRDALYVGDEVFLTGTAAEVTPVREVDKRKVGTGKPGDITKRVQEIYAAGVRGDVPWLKSRITTY
jgi:branched-chain amino acid aminotransferase